MTPTEGTGRADLVLRFKSLTERELPAQARAQRWPLRLDHCFKRVCLDWACGGCWYRHIGRPAERHANSELLKRGVLCADEILAGGRVVLAERDAASLRWRGKDLPSARRGASELQRKSRR